MSAALAVLVLLASAPVTAQPGLQPSEAGRGRQLLLSADAGQEQEVPISPDVGTLFLFDATVQLIGLEEREHFRRVTVTEDTLILVGSRELKLGQRLRMPVRFADGAAPARVDFLLVVVPSPQAERQVEVYRPSSPRVCQEEAREEREKARQCQAELARERAEPRGSSGLTGLLALEQMDDTGVLALSLKALTQPGGQTLEWWKARSYRATRPSNEGEENPPKVVRVAVELRVTNESTWPWTAAGAELVSGDGARRKLSVWQQGPIVPGRRKQLVVVEAEMMAEEARGTFTLELWEEGRARPVSFGGVSFP